MDEDGNSRGNYFCLPETMSTNPTIAVPSSAVGQNMAAMAASACSIVYLLEQEFDYEATTTNDNYDGEGDDGDFNFPLLRRPGMI